MAATVAWGCRVQEGYVIRETQRKLGSSTAVPVEGYPRYSFWGNWSVVLDRAFPGSAQESPLVVLRSHLQCWGPNWYWPRARQAPELNYYLSDPVLRILQGHSDSFSHPLLSCLISQFISHSIAVK